MGTVPVKSVHFSDGAYGVALAGFMVTEETLNALGIGAMVAAPEAAGLVMAAKSIVGVVGRSVLTRYYEPGLVKVTKPPRPGWVAYEYCGGAGNIYAYQFQAATVGTCGGIIDVVDETFDPVVIPSIADGFADPLHRDFAVWTRVSSHPHPVHPETIVYQQQMDRVWHYGTVVPEPSWITLDETVDQQEPTTDVDVDWYERNADALPFAESSGRVQTIVSSAARTSVSPAEEYSFRFAHPPLAGVREKKTRISNLSRFMFRAFSSASEGADFVDAVFDALPDDVKRRWTRKYQREKTTSDFYGQYESLNNVDWKMQAIYYNWDKLDAAKAVTNVVENEIEDRILGKGYGAKSDVQSGRVFHRIGFQG